jgi:cytochrome c oxidase subunit 1
MFKPITRPPPGENYLNSPKGIKNWLYTVDHKRIGVMYLWSVLTAFFLGGIMALLVRIELLTPKQTIMSAEAYNQVFTLHGAIMVFLFIIPSVPAALGNFLLPLMLGAKDVAFPRLNLLSFYIYVGRHFDGARRDRARRRRHRLDVLHAVLHHDLAALSG